MTKSDQLVAEKVARLKQALSEFEPEKSGLFDYEHEAQKADVARRALLLLDHRARSCQEMRERLLKLEFPAELVDEVIADLKRDHLLDDAEFASEWVRQRHERRGKSRRVLDQELKQKGIPAEARYDALSQITEDDEEERARKLAVKKAATLRVIPDQDDYHEYMKVLRRVVGMLARRGFNQSMSFNVAKEALEARAEELAAQD